MEEQEVPLERLQEEIHHHAQGEDGTAQWIMGVALSSALLAALAAVTALMAGHHANEAMIEQIQASDQWSYYQAKGVKAGVLGSKIDLLKAFEKEPSESDHVKLSEYKKDQDEIRERAEEKEKASKSHLNHHVVLARGVTMFQVAIAIGAISVLTRRRRFWFVSLGFGFLGFIFLIQGLLIQ